MKNHEGRLHRYHRQCSYYAEKALPERVIIYVVRTDVELRVADLLANKSAYLELILKEGTDG